MSKCSATKETSVSMTSHLPPKAQGPSGKRKQKDIRARSLEELERNRKIMKSTLTLLS